MSVLKALFFIGFKHLYPKLLNDLTGKLTDKPVKFLVKSNRNSFKSFGHWIKVS